MCWFYWYSFFNLILTKIPHIDIKNKIVAPPFFYFAFFFILRFFFYLLSSGFLIIVLLQMYAIIIYYVDKRNIHYQKIILVKIT